MPPQSVRRAVSVLVATTSLCAAQDLHVSPTGSDANPGTKDQPLATFAAAQQAARKQKGTVWFHAGTYYLPATLHFTAADAGITFAAAPGEQVVISGGMKLELTWEPYKDGILQAQTPAGLAIDQLFVNGQRQRMARYPNYDPDVLPYGGFSAEAFSKARAARWSDPTGGYIHAMHSAHWGGYHYRITGKNEKGEVTYEGGWQNNRQMGMHPQHRYVENIFEELDAPGEWFHNAKTNTLYYYPAAGTDLQTATIEVVRLRHLIEFDGAKHVLLCGFIFRHAARTFMDVKEPLLRSDWTIYRGGALRFNRSEDCTVADCELDQLGGNAVFVNGYNRRIRISGCDIHDTGATAVAFVGDPKSVRSPLFEYNKRQSYTDVDKTPGPKTEDYPADCVVDDCLIRHVGVVEKQATGVELSMAMGITIRHCSIYDASRAGINISEGTFGGHLIEFCDVFDTVKETGDHGSFNSWGRDRYWGLKDVPDSELPKLALLDVVKPNIIRNSRWRCDHGWDVDLDDGSSNYEIYNNLFLHGGLKLREGFYRRVWNNIAVNNSLHPHVWYANSGDIVTNNIWMGAYKPAVMRAGKWGQMVDDNLFTTTEADRKKFARNGCDEHSLVGDPLFVDPARGDYRVKDGSPAFKLGFKNFPMDQFGVQKPALKKIARTPELPGTIKAATAVPAATANQIYWQQAVVRNLVGEEFSAFGVSKESGGAQLEEIRAGSPLAAAGLQANDLIQSVNGQAVHNVNELLRTVDAAAGQPLNLSFVRGQGGQQGKLTDYIYLTTASPDQLGPALPVKSITTQPGTQNQPVAVLHDGRLTENYGPVFANGVRNGKYKLDLGRSENIVQVKTYSFNQHDTRGHQKFMLYGSNVAEDPGWDVSNAGKFTPIASVDTTATPAGKFVGTEIRRTTGSLGRFRWLVWVVQPARGNENTAYQEFVVVGAKADQP